MTFTQTAKFICLGIAVALASAVDAQAASSSMDVAVSIPENAVPKGYGSGWECGRGYRPEDGRCAPEPVPENAYKNKSTFGPIWRCKRGFAQQDATCVAIEVPVHGYLSSDGDSWICRRGFVKDGIDCRPIQVPANAFLSADTYGRGWDCERGYLARGVECAPIDVPDNAHLNFFGTGWECDPPFRRGEGGCVEP